MSYSQVDRTGIEPVTPTMSMWCSTAEPTILAVGNHTPRFFKSTSVRNRLLYAQYHLLQSMFQFVLQ
jgi:hypothetical protein